MTNTQQEPLSERPIPQLYQEFISTIIEEAKKELAKTGGVAPTFFVGNTSTKRMVSVSPSMANEEEKDLSSYQVKGMVMLENADFVLSIFSAWVLGEKYAERMEEILSEYGSIGESPYKQSALVFSLETVHSLWTAICPTTELKSGKKKSIIGEVKFRLIDSAQGRFAGFLQSPDSPEEGAKSQKMH